MTTSDLQPKPFKIKIQDKNYLCKQPRLSHRLIIGRVQPLFTAADDLANGKSTDITATQMIDYENDLDAMIQDLIPELKGIQLDIVDLAEIIGQIMEVMLPEESKELKEAKVEVSDPKAPSEAKI